MLQLKWICSSICFMLLSSSFANSILVCGSQPLEVYWFCILSAYTLEVSSFYVQMCCLLVWKSMFKFVCAPFFDLLVSYNMETNQNWGIWHLFVSIFVLGNCQNLFVPSFRGMNHWILEYQNFKQMNHLITNYQVNCNL